MNDPTETVDDVLADIDLIIEQDHGLTSPARSLKEHLISFRDRIERAMAESAGPMCIVCDWQGDTARFIEAEIDGASVSLPWNDRPDGLKELRIERIVGPASLVTERMRKLAMAAFLSSKSDELIDCIGDALAAAHAPPAVPASAVPVACIDARHLQLLRQDWKTGNTLKHPKDAGKGDVLLYAHAPPAVPVESPPASVPEWTDEQCIQFACIAFRHAPKNLPKGVTLQDIRMGAYRVMNSTTPEESP